MGWLPRPFTSVRAKHTVSSTPAAGWRLSPPFDRLSIATPRAPILRWAQTVLLARDRGRGHCCRGSLSRTTAGGKERRSTVARQPGQQFITVYGGLRWTTTTGSTRNTSLLSFWGDTIDAPDEDIVPAGAQEMVWLGRDAPSCSCRAARVA
jgi:hypothetical protein